MGLVAEYPHTAYCSSDPPSSHACPKDRQLRNSVDWFRYTLVQLWHCKGREPVGRQSNSQKV